MVVLEAEQQVGGLAKTVVRDGYRFDLGGHRFFTKSPEVESLWLQLLGEELLLRSRLSRIYWNGHFLDYPLSACDAVRRLGQSELTRCLASYLAAVPRRKGASGAWRSGIVEPVQAPPTTSSSGRTRRRSGACPAPRSGGVGSPADQGLADDGRARRAPRRAPWRGQEPHPEFTTPALRAGRINGRRWRSGSAISAARCGPGPPSSRIRVDHGQVVAVNDHRCDEGDLLLPLGSVAGMTAPAPPADALEAAQGRYRYRDFLTVALVLRGEDLFPDNWIYVRSVRAGRAHPELPLVEPVDGAGERDDVHRPPVLLLRGRHSGRRPTSASSSWRPPGSAGSGCAQARVERGYVERVPKAYPVYDERYAERLVAVRRWLDGLENLQQSAATGSTGTTTPTIRC